MAMFALTEKALVLKPEDDVAVAKARNVAYAAGQKAAANPGDPEAMKQLNQAEGQLGGALGRLLAVAEAYPDLKANQNML